MASIKQAVLGVVGSRMLPMATVTSVDPINPLYTLFDLTSDSFKGAVWEPASKIQVDVGGWAMRTYTPIEIDGAGGVVRLLGFVHGDTPAAAWLRRLQPGTVMNVAGPKSSLPGATQPAVFFGDETSLPAAATTRRGGGALTPALFEVDAVEEAEDVADRLGLDNRLFIRRRANQGHLPEVVAAIEQWLDRVPGASLILTGNGKSVQAVRAALRGGRHGGVRQQVKAYWSPGKVGLD